MKYVVILGVVAFALAGFIYYTLFSAPVPTGQSTLEGAPAQLADDRPDVANTEPTAGQGTLESLRQLGRDLECTIAFRDPAEQTTVEGTYFVSDGSMRGDFITDAPDLSGQLVSSMIIDDTETLYVWSEIEGESYGVKLDLSTIRESEMETPEPVALDANVQYDCKPWVMVDRTVFVPPADVLFQDMSALMQGGMEYGTIYEGAVVPELP